jgi:hypothetical protein
MGYQRRSQVPEQIKVEAKPEDLAAAKLRAVASFGTSGTDDAMHVAVVEALRVGLTQERIASLSGYGQERIRDIAHRAGIGLTIP